MKKIYYCCLILTAMFSNAQTDFDGIMMDKKNLCIGPSYQYSSFNQYWEGTWKRENLNMGTISTKTTSIMGNYGVTDKLNVLFNANYVSTSASAGTLLGQKGWQDFSMMAKYMPYEKEYKKFNISTYIVSGFSVPMTNYVADFLPLSIGLQSKTAMFRLMTDIQRGKFYTTISGTYLYRNNITIDRNAYFTTEYHYTNEVFMPNMMAFNFRIGYRTDKLIADVYFDNIITQKGGFDISKNNMPFPSNTMNSSKIGLYAKYFIPKVKNLSLIAGYSQVVDGRNVGQSTTIDGGLFYVLDFSKKEAKK